MSEKKDRRNHPRLPVSIPVEYNSLSDFFVDYAIDISHGGMFIATERNLDRGAPVEISFIVREIGETFTATGKVARIRAAKSSPGSIDGTSMAGIGIKFDPLPENSKSIIEKLWRRKIKEND